MEPDNSRREIKGRNQDIRLSGKYEERKDVSYSKEKEYVLINKEKKAYRNTYDSPKNGYGHSEADSLTSADFSDTSDKEYQEADYRNYVISKKKKEGGDAEEPVSVRGINIKKTARFTVKSLRRLSDNVNTHEEALANPDDMETNTKKQVNKITACVFYVMSKIGSLALSVASAFLSYIGILIIGAIIIGILVITCVKNATYDFIADEEKYLREHVSQINSEFINEMEQLASEAGCSEIVMQGKLTSWKNIIAFWWAFKMNVGDTEKWENFFTGNDYDDLKKLFYEFNHVTSQVNEEDGKKTLLVTVTNTSMEDMVKDYGFSSKQKEYLDKLLAADEIWNDILYADELAAIAASEIGISKDKYVNWYPLSEGESWNMAFMMYCLDYGGYLVTGCITKTNNADSFMQEMMKKGYVNFFEGKEGDILFFYMNSVLKTGIITRVDDTAYYVTMGGYTDSDVVCEIAISKGSGMIRCFAKIEAFNITLGNESTDVVKTGQFVWPASGEYYVTSCFKWRWGRQHQGLDIGCPEGTPILAADNGTVIISQYSSSAGNYVMIDHGTYKTVYMHNSELKVMVGDKVTAGQIISLSGNTGNSTGPHLHFGVMVNGVYTDPAPYLGLPSNWEGDASVYIKNNSSQETGTE